MKSILIDAKWLYNGPTSGKVVVKQQVKQLERFTSDYRITLIVDKNDPNISKYETLGFFTLKIPNYSLLTNLLIFPFLFYFNKFDVCLFQNYTPIISRNKSIVFVHDIIFYTHPNFFSLFERLMFRFILLSLHLADEIVTISENERSRIKNYLKKNKTIHVVYNGVDHLISNYKSVEKNGVIKSTIDVSGKYVLYVGRINDRKNVKNLITSFNYLSRLDVKLVIAGGDDWQNTLNKIPSERILFTGYVSDDDLIWLYNNASIFAFVSYEEGFGLPPLEAMSYNLPVIVSNTSCFPEVCGNAAVFVDPNKPKDIASKIEKLLNDEDLRNQLKRNGEVRVRRFTWENSIKKLIDILGK